MAAMTVQPVPPGAVLVGVDGSPESTRAVRWAAQEAALLGAALHVVHAWVWPLYRVPLGAGTLAPPGSGLQAQAERVLADAEAVARAVAPDVRVSTSLLVGGAAPQLLHHCTGARLVVVGHRGLGGFTGLLLGSVGITLSAHAPIPVVVVRGVPADDGPVVVGVDDSPAAADVVDVAFQEAARRGAELVAVHAWTVALGTVDGGFEDYHQAAADGERAGRRLLEAVVARVAPRYPEVATTTLRLGDRSAAAELVDASTGAQLVVVGSRGVGGLRGLLLGSTAHAVIHHAACPVLVERVPAHPPAEPSRPA